MTASVSRGLNIVFLLAVCAILLGAFAVQFLFGELPCPLCLLQRVGFIGVGLGATLNVVYGTRPRNYGVSLLSSIFGGAVACRHILLHIAPGSPVHGWTFLGMHLYTLSLVAFVAIAVLISLMLHLDRQFASGYSAADDTSAGDEKCAKRLGVFPRLVLLLFILIVAANLVCTVLLCGLGPCPSDPTHYLLLGGSINLPPPLSAQASYI